MLGKNLKGKIFKAFIHLYLYIQCFSSIKDPSRTENVKEDFILRSIIAQAILAETAGSTKFTVGNISTRYLQL